MNTPTILFLRRTNPNAELAAHLAAGLIALLPICVPPPIRGQSNVDAGTGAASRHDRLLVRPVAGADLSALHAALGTAVLREFSGIGGLQVVQLPAGADAATSYAIGSPGSATVTIADNDAAPLPLPWPL